MPLSEEEMRLLEQMERALVHEDPKLAHTLRGTTARATARQKAIAAGLGFVAGLAALISGAYFQFPLLGVVGFVIMLAGATVALGALRTSDDSESTQREESLRTRMEHRFRRDRKDDGA